MKQWKFTMNRKLVELLEIKLLLNLEQSFILFPGTHGVPIELGELGALWEQWELWELGELGEIGELRELGDLGALGELRELG